MVSMLAVIGPELCLGLYLFKCVNSVHSGILITFICTVRINVQKTLKWILAMGRVMSFASVTITLHKKILKMYLGQLTLLYFD